ncbi:efflux RND transporter periplasmic adaptor subunit [Marinilabilia rubra]|uniref:Efflux RND transporter periplasmic adaptor subunit n=1 Tax=Marinilabilia rubra TaxID=2162893 RepID=A0A2U2BBL0_9BACT|nr:efflux RND transporter periplasmic adaptor subunit [Marinilabilia rubra]PWE00464.1 efflux RND transporter periplasmic adaptor subunit [Marinilabilia rubra]
MKRKSLIIIAGLAILGLGLAFIFRPGTSEDSFMPRIKVVEEGNIVNTVTATGTVEPIDQVEVGTQVSGVIEEIFTDYNERVEKGQLIARIDESTLSTRLLQARSSLASAENELDYQQKNFNRTQKLYEKQMVSETVYDEVLYKYRNAQTSVESLKSEVEQAEVNLSYARIYSPIEGVVLSKSVEVGQTVAASFNTPTLFLIAKDLTRMQVEADVDEADIGQVEVGQEVAFTVDAFPDTEFKGEVIQIRLEPAVESNVVTYTVIIDAPNSELKLKPGLTASVTIVTRQVKNVPVVPVAALRFEPDQGMLGEMPPFPGKPGRFAGRPDGEENKRTDGDNDKIWVMEDGKIHQIPVQAGLEDGVMAEISRGINVGDSIVTGLQSNQEPSAMSARSPFMPSRPGGGEGGRK